jgi:hypothetical protein
MTSSDIKPELLPFDEIVRRALKSVPQLVSISNCRGPFESYPQHYYMFPALSAHSARSGAAFDLPEVVFSPTLKMRTHGAATCNDSSHAGNLTQNRHSK